MRPWLVLHAFGIQFTEKLIPFDGFSESSQFKQTVAKYSPAVRVPFMQCSNSASPPADPLIIWETLAIIEYLAEQNPQLKIWPRNVALRAQARSLCAEMQSGFFALRRHCPMNIDADLPQIGRLIWRDKLLDRKDIERIETAWRNILNFLKVHSWQENSALYMRFMRLLSDVFRLTNCLFQKIQPLICSVSDSTHR